jgi:hypothetical protein
MPRGNCRIGLPTGLVVLSSAEPAALDYPVQPPFNRPQTRDRPITVADLNIGHEPRQSDVEPYHRAPDPRTSARVWKPDGIAPIGPGRSKPGWWQGPPGTPWHPHRRACRHVPPRDTDYRIRMRCQWSLAPALGRRAAWNGLQPLNQRFKSCPCMVHHISTKAIANRTMTFQN